MFSKLRKTNWSSALLKIADVERRAEDERPEHKELYKTILDFIVSFDDYVLDEIDLHFEGKILRSFNVYMDDAAVKANKLANIIAEKFSFTILKTMEPRYHYTILVNGRTVAEIRDLTKLLDIEYLMPWKVTYKTWSINVIPPDVYLLELYHKLYNPSHADSWDTIKSQIAHLEHLQEVKEGGGNSNKQDLTEELNKIINIMRNQMIKVFLPKHKDTFLLAGRTAVSIMNNEQQKYIDQLQLIVSIHVKDATALIMDELAHDAIKMHVVNQDINVPYDFRMRKYTVYASFHEQNNERVQKPLLELFTSAQYELVPYIDKDNIRISHPLVTLRLQYIDIWILKLLLQEGKMTKETIHHIMQKKFKTISSIRKNGEIEQPTQWLGTWSNADIDYKLMAFKKRKDTSLPTFPYKPYIYFQQHGVYRTFG